MWTQRAEGDTLKKIGEDFGVSKQTVSHIIATYVYWQLQRCMVLTRAKERHDS